jgi:uncharacterized repeat protein (TIGR03803 family)
LIQAADGDIYGTTSIGGAAQQGTIFKITPGGTLSTVYNFNPQNGLDSYSGLLQATDGNFYGETQPKSPYFVSSVFKITPTGKWTTLYVFPLDTYPEGGLIQAADGNFYGTTELGGAYNYGTIFKITPLGSLTTLYNFCPDHPTCPDGISPLAGLVQAMDGNFYGTTAWGGAQSSGTIFKITPGGTLTTLHNFNSTDGANPFAPLLQGTNGEFYGTTIYGGDLACYFGAGCGTVFSLATGLGPFVETRPSAGKVGANITILGTNLTGASQVTFNGTPAKFTVVSSSEITTTVPLNATTGPVRVTTPGGTLRSNVVFRVKP